MSLSLTSASPISNSLTSDAEIHLNEEVIKKDNSVSVIKYTVDDFNSLKKRGDFMYYFKLLLICSRKSEEEERQETNLEHLPVEILSYIAEMAHSSIDIFFMRYSGMGKFQYPVRNGYDTYILRKCKIHSLKAKSSLYAIGQLTDSPPIKIQGVRIARIQKPCVLKEESHDDGEEGLNDDTCKNIVSDFKYDYFNYNTSNFKFQPKDFILLMVCNHPFTYIPQEPEKEIIENMIRLKYFSKTKEIHNFIQ
jgi:hypothetical protein